MAAQAVRIVPHCLDPGCTMFVVDFIHLEPLTDHRGQLLHFTRRPVALQERRDLEDADPGSALDWCAVTIDYSHPRQSILRGSFGSTRTPRRTPRPLMTDIAL